MSRRDDGAELVARSHGDLFGGTVSAAVIRRGIAWSKALRSLAGESKRAAAALEADRRAGALEPREVDGVPVRCRCGVRLPCLSCRV